MCGKFLAVFALLFCFGIARAEEGYSCKSGKSERKIWVSYSQEGKKVPCEVKYLKEGETDAQTKWTAQGSEGFCEKKAEELAGKLQAAGWDCGAPAAHEDAPKTE